MNSASLILYFAVYCCFSLCQQSRLYGSEVIATLNKYNGAPNAHGRQSIVGGKLMTIFAPDGAKPGGGIAFFDIANPKNPKLIKRIEDESTRDIREAHGFGFIHQGKKTYAVLQALFGIQVWDVSDVTKAEQVAYLKLPGVRDSDYTHGVWWLSVAQPFVYVGGSTNGIYVVNIENPENPLLEVLDNGMKNPMPISSLGGFRVGPIFAVGDTLFYSNMEEKGFGLMDISNPKAPRLLKTQTDIEPSYSTLVVGDEIFGAGIDEKFHIYKLSRNTETFAKTASVKMNGRGGYISHKDGIAYAGASNSFVAVNLRDPLRIPPAYRVPFTDGDMDWDFATIVGEHIIVSDDHGYGSLFYKAPDIKEKDTTPPKVLKSYPNNFSSDLDSKGGIGLSLSENIDPGSIQNDKIYFLDSTQVQIPTFTSVNMGVLNIFPQVPLSAETRHELVIEKEAFADYSGNRIDKNFTFVFTTRSFQAGFNCHIIKANRFVEVGKEIELTGHIQNSDKSTQWTWKATEATNTPSNNQSVSLQFDTVGRKHVQLEVKQDKASGNCNTQIVVHNPIDSLPNVNSSSLAYDQANRLLWTANPDNDTVTAVHATTVKKSKEVKVGKKPKSLAVIADTNELWVVNHNSDSISIIDLSTQNVVDKIQLDHGAYPFAILKNPSNENVYVSLYGKSTVVRIHSKSRRIEKTLLVGRFPGSMALHTAEQKLYINRFISDKNAGSVYTVDLTSFSTLPTIELIKDTSEDREDQGRGLPNYLGQMQISPDSKRLWIPAKKDNIERGIVRDGLPLKFDNTVRAMLSEIDLSTDKEALNKRFDFNDRALPTTVQFTKHGDAAFIGFLSSNAIELRDTYTGKLLSGIESLPSPDGMYLSADNKILYVHSFLNRRLYAYSVNQVLNHGESQIKLMGVTSLVAQEKLREEVLAGKKVFYNANDLRMSRDGYISCAVCHIDGGHDGQTWDFTDRGEGLRNTTSLLGRKGTGQGRLHWSANFDEVQDFEHDIRQAFGGLGFISDDKFFADQHSKPLGTKKAGLSKDLDNLSAYLESLEDELKSPQREPDGSQSEAATKGEAIFKQLNCQSCHGGADFTLSSLDSSELFDVGTLKLTSGKRLGGPLRGIDTPTLKGLWHTAPYLHDGSAETLKAVFKSDNLGEGHDAVSTLTVQEFDELLRYILSIE